MQVQKNVAENWQNITGNVLSVGYGLSETSPAASIDPIGVEKFSDSLGLPLPSTEISIQDDQGNLLDFNIPGEICIRGPQVMKGYWNNNEETKNVLTSESKGIFQGKIYVRDLAQKTDAYQLSKALLLNDNAEFNSKPELEIYADDVKCSHGSTSGSLDEDALYYLMSRGLNRKDSVKLLTKGFLSDIVDFIKSVTIKKFVETKLEEQINGY